MVRVRSAVPVGRPDRRRRRVVARERGRARAGGGEVGRAAGDRGRDRRHRDELRPAHGLVPRDRRAGDAGVRLPAPRPVLPRRAEGVPAALWRAGLHAARPEGIVCRRDGRAAVHAGQLPSLRGRLRRRRAHRPVGERRGRRRQRGELPRAARLAARRADDRAGGDRRRASRRGAAAPRRRHERAAPVRRLGRGWRRSGRARRARRRAGRAPDARGIAVGRELLDRLPEFLRDHALQPQPALRVGGDQACRGDPGGQVPPPGRQPGSAFNPRLVHGSSASARARPARASTRRYRARVRCRRRAPRRSDRRGSCPARRRTGRTG